MSPRLTDVPFAGETDAAASPLPGPGPDTPTLGAAPSPPLASVPAASPERIGRYEIRGAIGRGGFGCVLRGYDRVLDREVAVKVLHPGFEVDPDLHERFFREARAAARLQHSNIVSVFEVGDHEGRPFIASELVRGEDLERTAARAPLAYRRAAEVARDIARAVEAAHAAGIVHRDLKPSNVLLGEDGRPRLTDFGLARDLRSAPITEAGAVLGTPTYMAPEQLGEEAARGTPSTDIYSLGAILYRLLAGRPPFAGITPVNVFKAVLLDVPPPPHDFRPNVPKALETIALRCLEKDPAKRYASAGAVAADLDAFLTAASAVTPEPDVEPPGLGPAPTSLAGGSVLRPGRREGGLLEEMLQDLREVPEGSRRRRSWLLATFAVGAVGLAALLWVYWPEAKDRTTSGSPVAAAPELDVQVVPIVIPFHGGAREARAGVGETPAVREGDGIRFELELSQPAHLYLFNVDGAGKAYCLFPTAYADYYRGLVDRGSLARLPLENPVPKGQALIPTPLPEIDAPHAWFQFDSTRGLERYYLFAAPDPIAELEALAKAAPGAMDEAEAARRLAHAVEATRGSHRIVTGTSPAEIRLTEAPDRKLDAIAARLKGRVVVWEYAIPHE